jgi:uncharacterized protein (TIGR01777 family)
MIGSALVDALSNDGHEIIRLVRSPSPSAFTEVVWDPTSEEMVPDRKLEELDAVFHLAAEPVMGRWTPDKRVRIRNSRVHGTALLCRALAKLEHKPACLLSASAIGYYGDTAHREVDETAPPGEGFLAEVCRDWEAAAIEALDAGIRVVNARFGVVLSPRGGALKAMWLPFRLGLGGKLGTGKQYMSWISIRDTTRALLHVLDNKDVAGPVNMVAPDAVTNAELTRVLGKAVSRPTVFPVPAFVLRALFGEMAEDTFLSSARVVPGVLNESGFEFQDADLSAALVDMLG